MELRHAGCTQASRGAKWWGKGRMGQLSLATQRPSLVLHLPSCCSQPWSWPHEKSCLRLGSLKKHTEDTINLFTNILQLVSSKAEVPSWHFAAEIVRGKRGKLHYLFYLCSTLSNLSPILASPKVSIWIFLFCQGPPSVIQPSYITSIPTTTPIQAFSCDVPPMIFHFSPTNGLYYICCSLIYKCLWW